MALSDNQKGVALMIAASAGFVLTDTLFQLISGDVSVAQFLFLRGILITTGMFVIAKRTRKPFPKEWAVRKKMVLRGIFEIVLAYCFLTALAHLPLSTATAMNQTVPLVMTLVAYFILGERFGWPRAIAILVGFIGVLMIIQPGLVEVGPYYILLIIAVLCITARDLISKSIPAEVPTAWVAFVTLLMVAIVSAFVSLGERWQAIDGSTAWMIVLISCFSLAAHFLIVATMRVGDVSFVTPFRYSAILFAVLIDVFILRLGIDWLTLLGCVLVSGAGIYTLLRERRRKLAQISKG